MEKVVQVGMVTGETISVTVKSISSVAMKRLKRMVMPAKVNPNSPLDYTVDYTQIEKYQDEIIQSSIESPASMKNSIDQIDAPSYEKLLKAAEEVNRLTEQEQKNLQ